MSMELYYQNYLSHHGIRGQRWGKRNGPPYPLSESKHSASEKKAGWKKSLDKGSNEEDTTSKKKQYSEVGAKICASLLNAYGTYKVSAIAGIRKSIHSLFGNGQELTKRDSRSNVVTDRKNELRKDSKLYNVLDNKNPTGDSDNCKELASAAACRANGIDVVAGHKTTNGTLSDIFEDTYGIYDKVKSIHTAETDTPDEIKDKVVRNITKRYTEGDVGCIDIEYSDRYKKMTKELLGIDVEGHAFNWCIEDGQVSFACSQPGYPMDLGNAFTHVKPGKDVEIVMVDKETAEKISKHF